MDENLVVQGTDSYKCGK